MSIFSPDTKIGFIKLFNSSSSSLFNSSKKVYDAVQQNSYLIMNIKYNSCPPRLAAHSTALINKKLYFIGGDDSITDDHNSFFYLDLNQYFDVQSLPYVVLNVTPVGILLASACVGGANNDTIFVFGGTNSVENPSQITDKLINTYNTASKEWSTPQIEGEPIRRRNIQAVIDAKGKMYIFGGFNSLEDYTTTYFKDMIIFDTITFTYSSGSTIDGPLSMSGYTATLLPNGIIMYIGGLAQNYTIISIKNIIMYDINENSWNYTTAKSPKDIEDRSYHSAVLTNDCIICYGGVERFYATVSPSLIVLNTTSFEWSFKEDIGTNAPPRLYLHSANLVENYMIIAFGNETSSITSSRIYILDIRNYTWISYYEASLPSPPPATDQPKPLLSVGAIIGITIEEYDNDRELKQEEFLLKYNETLDNSNTNIIYSKENENNETFEKENYRTFGKYRTYIIVIDFIKGKIQRYGD
ncbi:hypothetical protein Glove_21g244 [Diversispora epigaea]|uniref:Galactose oxidase n=1 Tax=Diversispora epigaea TaxID=1348612 RepID=A0A397JL34_9GLOM|nr:hypothetical protein Glove_21g244 [Diversispora epigaea]